MFSSLLSGIQSISQSIAVPVETPPIKEEQLALFKEHGISEEEANSLIKTIAQSDWIWRCKGEKVGCMVKDHVTPRNLLYRVNPEVESDLEVFIACENRVVGKGDYMTYVKALEHTSQKTYVLGVVSIRDKIRNGKVISKGGFQKEADQLKMAFEIVGEHPQIVKLHAVIDYQPKFTKHVAFIFDYCELGNLEKYVEKSGELKEREIRQIALDVAKALEYMHSKGLAHYDVKEANILLTDGGDGLSAKLGDFGFAAGFDGFVGNGTPTNLPVEFWESYPPTSIDDYKKFDGRSLDQWAFGTVLYGINEKKPFIPDEIVENIERACASITNQVEREEAHLEQFKKFILSLVRDGDTLKIEADEKESMSKLYRQMLQFDPAKRPASMTEVRSRLEEMTS